MMIAIMAAAGGVRLRRRATIQASAVISSSLNLISSNIAWRQVSGRRGKSGLV